MPKLAYEVLSPQKPTSCVVFASPHSGCDYAHRFLQQTILDRHRIRSSEDAFVDRFFECAPQFGANFLKAGAPRAFVDLNRNIDELDPALIEGIQHVKRNPRVAAGLGVIPRVVAAGRSIYRGKISQGEALRRISLYWRPYHQVLQSLLNETHQRYGQAVLIDCHSMPREATNGVVKGGMRRPDIVLGDRYGLSAASEVVDYLEAAFTAAGFEVARNTPFAGAYITQAYGVPAKRQHAVQVEIDRSIYMDEALIRPNENFDAVQATLRGVVKDVAGLGRDNVRLAGGITLAILAWWG